MVALLYDLATARPARSVRGARPVPSAPPAPAPSRQVAHVVQLAQVGTGSACRSRSRGHGTRGPPLPSARVAASPAAAVARHRLHARTGTRRPGPERALQHPSATRRERRAACRRARAAHPRGRLALSPCLAASASRESRNRRRRAAGRRCSSFPRRGRLGAAVFWHLRPSVYSFPYVVLPRWLPPWRPLA